MTAEAPGSENGLKIVGQVAVGFPPAPGSYAGSAYGNAQPNTQTATWLFVRPEGSVTVYAGKVEYGQGIRTGLAMAVADELRMPLEAVEVVLGDTDSAPWDMGTFGSLSTALVGLQLRRAAATARQALLELAASRLDLPASELVCRDGRVTSHHDSGRSMGYGELVAGQSLSRDLMEDAALTPADEFTIMGKAAQRIDAVARVTGQALYSYDIVVPDMLFAKVLRPPSYGAKLIGVDPSAAERMPGR